MKEKVCTCASFFTVRGTHKADCPAYKDNCACGGKYPNLETHTPKRCYTEFPIKNPDTMVHSGWQPKDTSAVEGIVAEFDTVIKPDWAGTIHLGNSEKKKMKKWLTKSLHSLLKSKGEEMEGMKHAYIEEYKCGGCGGCEACKLYDAEQVKATNDSIDQCISILSADNSKGV